jgi:hypothetical protein
MIHAFTYATFIPRYAMQQWQTITENLRSKDFSKYLVSTLESTGNVHSSHYLVPTGSTCTST